MMIKKYERLILTSGIFIVVYPHPYICNFHDSFLRVLLYINKLSRKQNHSPASKPFFGLNLNVLQSALAILYETWF